jgi:hypothetical protein
VKFGFRTIVGALALLRRRCREVGRPGLTVYAEAGTLAAKSVGERVRAAAHANEVDEGALGQELQAMLADGKIDREELRRLRRAPARLHRCAERSHDIGEAVS